MIRLVPRSLLTRTFLLVSLLLVVTLGCWLVLFSLAEREPRARQAAQLTASVVNLTRAALVSASPDRRLALLRDLAESEHVYVYPAEPDDEIEDLPDSYYFDVMKRETTWLLGGDHRLAGRVNDLEGFWVRFAIGDAEDDQYWLMLPDDHASPEFPWHWLSQGVLSLVLALVVTWLIVSRVTLPLRRLASAAHDVGEGRHPERLPERGASELVELTAAFNRMSDDLRQSASERAEILAGISHDLRTPLARLRLEAELSIVDEAARAAAVADIEQMNGIIAQFLDYARGDGGETPQVGDINALIASLVAARRWPARAPQLEPGDVPPARLLPRALGRAIANLIDNAHKYAGDEVSVATRLDGGEIVIDVADRGPGVPDDERERLKRPFTRLAEARTDASGTGLGLAIVERVARLHGGSFDLLPRPGGGLIARLRIPAAA